MRKASLPSWQLRSPASSNTRKQTFCRRRRGDRSERQQLVIVDLDLVVDEVLAAPHHFPAQAHLLDRLPQDVGVDGCDVVDEQENIFVGIDVLSVAAFDVERGGVIDIERQTGRDTPGLLQIVVEIVATKAREAPVCHQTSTSTFSHTVLAGGELVHPPRGEALGVLRTSREGRDIGEVDVGAGADHPPEPMIVIVLDR